MQAPDPAPGRGIADLMAALAAMPTARAPDFRDMLPDTLKAQRAFDLRTRLAVRGWTNPRSLFTDNERDADFEAALNVVADEVETAITLHPGCWYLAVPGRRRVLVDRAPSELTDELATPRSPADALDPVWRAMRAELEVEPLPPLVELDDAAVSALGLVRSWLGGDHDSPAARTAVAAELAARERRADIARLTAHGLIGAVHLAALGALREVAGDPFAAGRPATAIYVYGDGGAGKSTLLAMLEAGLAESADRPPLVRLDFDDRRLDPFDPLSLDVALFEQLLGQCDPDTARRFGSTIAMLGRLRLARRDTRAETTTYQGKRGSRAESFDATNSLLDERTTIFEGSERGAAVYGALASQSWPRTRPLILILDTIEVVSARGAAAIDGLAQWLASLGTIMGGADLRLVVAGRDPPQAGDLFAVLASLAGFDIQPALRLPELNADEAMTFLVNAGVTEPGVAAAAAGVLPGNPLLLSIAADVLVRDPGIAADVHSAHAAGRIDRETAARFLSQRIVPHVADPVARPYILPAMYLPVVTLPLLQNVVMPLVDAGFPAEAGDDLAAAGLPDARRVLAAFADSRWLTRPSEDLAQLRFHADLRTLVLKLLAADPEARVREDAVRRRAIEFHRGRRSDEDRAWATYHALMRGDPLPDGSNRVLLIRTLAPVLDDLPVAARAALLGEADDIGPLPPMAAMPLPPMAAMPLPPMAAMPLPPGLPPDVSAPAPRPSHPMSPPMPNNNWLGTPPSPSPELLRSASPLSARMLLLAAMVPLVLVVGTFGIVGSRSGSADHPALPPAVAVPGAGPATFDMAVAPGSGMIGVAVVAVLVLVFLFRRLSRSVTTGMAEEVDPDLDGADVTGRFDADRGFDVGDPPTLSFPDPPPAASPDPTPEPAAAAPDWSARLEIEGPRFVKRNNAPQALALFRQQPWPHPGAPPTFVIQALADTAAWDSSEVDDAAVLGEIEARLPGRLRLELVSRLYWLTRLALMRGDGQLSPRHVDCLRAACGPLANGIGFSGLPALVAVVEAAIWQQSGRFEAVAPPQWVAGKGPVATTRLALVRSLADAGEVPAGPVRIDNIIVTQTDWRARLREHKAIVDLPDDDRLQGHVNALHGLAFGEVNLFLRDVRGNAPATVRLQASAPAGDILVMRGLTTEFLRPLAHTLALWLRVADVNSGLPRAIGRVIMAMTVVPQEFVPERFAVMLDLDPESWAAALVGYADRSRLLPHLCEALLAADDPAPERFACQRVARACLAWDKLLCGGGSSAW